MDQPPMNWPMGDWSCCFQPPLFLKREFVFHHGWMKGRENAEALLISTGGLLLPELTLCL